MSQKGRLNKKIIKMKHLFSAWLLVLAMAFPALSQTVKVTGTVTEQGTGETLPGVNILVEGKTIGTITNLDGQYTIEVGVNETLVFSFTGMKTAEEIVGGRSVIDVSLVADNKVLDEVMVVSYGTTTKEAYTGSAQVVDSEQIENRPVVSVEKALQGTTAGLQITASSGQPGAASAIRIRGIGSLNASSSPLIVVDGVPFSGGLNDINPNDIQSINTIKDASGAALYGSRAANGVIIITTKKGEKGNTRISFSVQQGVTERISEGYDLMNSTQFYQHAWQGLYNQSVLSDTATLLEARRYADERVENVVGFNPFGVENPLDDYGRLIPGTIVNTDTDWRNLIYKRGKTQNYNVNVAGGNEDTKAYFSLGYLSNEGIVISSDYERYTGKINLSHKVNKYITAGVTSNFSMSESNTIPTGGASSNIVRSAEVLNAATPVYTGDGEYNWVNEVTLDFNPLGLAEMDIYRSKTIGAMVNSYVKVQFLPYLYFQTTGAIDYLSGESITYYNPEHGNGAGVNGRGSQGRSSSQALTLSNILGFDKQFDKHYVQALIGQEAYQQTSSSLSAEVTDFAIPEKYHLMWGAQPETPSSGDSQWAMLSYLGNVKYEFDGKLNLSFSYRMDGSSRFGKGNKYGSFYSLGAGWTISQEQWMPQTDWLNYLRLRASYGTSGNADIGNFASMGLYAGGANYGGFPGVSLAQLSNPSLSWEKQNMLNLGFETTMFDRLKATVEYYVKSSDALLYARPLSASKGLGSILTNLGAMENKGIELVLSYDAVKTRNFNYSLGLNLTKNINEIRSLNGDPIKSGTKILEEGSSMYQFYLREWAGVNPENGDPMWYTNADSDDDETNEGEPENAFLDPFGSGRMVTSEYGEAERVRLGLSLPDFYGGFTNNLRYKNFDLSFYFYFSVGGQIYNSDYAQNMHDGTTPGANLSTDALNAWTPENRFTNVPRYVANNPMNSSGQSSRFLEDASFLRLKNVSLTYNLPALMCKKIGFKAGKVFASAENLWTLTGYRGFDPEAALSGVTNNNIPGVKTYTLGLKVDL